MSAANVVRVLLITGCPLGSDDVLAISITVFEGHYDTFILKGVAFDYTFVPDVVGTYIHLGRR